MRGCMFRGAGRIAGRCCICEGRLVVLLRMAAVGERHCGRRGAADDGLMIGKGMKRFFAFALAALVLLSGCCPGRTALSPSVSDSLQVEREVRYVEKLRDTVIYVEVPVESRRVRVAADSSFLETSLATSSARVAADGTLSHTLENKPQRQPVGVTVRDTFERESELSGSVRTERVEVPVQVPLSWFQKSLMGCGLFALAFGVGWAVFRIVRRRFGR